MERLPKESDWRTLRRRVPEWRERYLSSKIKEIILVLIDEGATPTERFWKVKERIDEEARILVDCLDGHSRYKMQSLLRYTRLLFVQSHARTISAAKRRPFYGNTG